MKIKLNQFDLIIFDFDGVIIDSNNIKTQALKMKVKKTLKDSLNITN